LKMTTKTTKKARPKPIKPASPRKSPQIEILPTDSEEVIASKYASMVASPELAAYRVINGAEIKSGIGDALDVPALMDQLREQAAAVRGGNMGNPEAMLMNQATALQSLFARLAERGMGCENAVAFETNMRIALRAQSQCRATLETLAAIKNPPIVYARQANVTTGPQQINNGTVQPMRAREIESEQSQLSGEIHELLPDTRASGNASRVNPALETVGEIDRAKVARG
jgi:hypothetical protein